MTQILYMATKIVPETETKFMVPFPPTSFLLLTDNSFVLKVDGVSKIGLLSS